MPLKIRTKPSNALYREGYDAINWKSPCRYCNQGWTTEDDGTGEPVQVGCDYCNGTGFKPAK